MTGRPTAPRTRVLLVEDDPSVQQVIALLLSTETDLEVVGCVDTAEDAIARAAVLQPDVVVLDQQLLGPMTGLEAAPAIRRATPGVVLLMCSALDVLPVIESGTPPLVDGYLRKDDLADLVERVRELLPAGAEESG